MKKRILSIILILIMVLGFSVTATAETMEQTDITVYVDGNQVIFDMGANPIITQGRTLVPMRAIFQALGYTVDWDGQMQRITARGDRVIIMHIGSLTASIDGISVDMEVAPATVNDRTMVPLRFVGEASGAPVDWDATRRVITIATLPNAPEPQAPPEPMPPQPTPPEVTQPQPGGTAVLIGGWQRASGGPVYFFGVSDFIEFKEGNILTELENNKTAIWTADGANIFLQNEEVGAQSFTYTLEGNTLTITDTTGAVIVYTRISR